MFHYLQNNRAYNNITKKRLFHFQIKNTKRQILYKYLKLFVVLKSLILQFEWELRQLSVEVEVQAVGEVEGQLIGLKSSLI